MNDEFGMCDKIDGDVVHFGSESEEEHDNVIRDEFHTLEEVQEAIRKQGLETCNLIFGKYIFKLIHIICKSCIKNIRKKRNNKKQCI